MIGRRGFVSGVIAAAFVPAASKAADNSALLDSMRSMLLFSDKMASVRDTLSGVVKYEDGSSETVTMSMDLGKGDFTIEAWYMPNGEVHHTVLIDKDNTTTFYADHEDLRNSKSMMVAGKKPYRVVIGNGGYPESDLPKDWLTNPDINLDGSRKKGLVIELGDDGEFLNVVSAP